MRTCTEGGQTIVSSMRIADSRSGSAGRRRHLKALAALFLLAISGLLLLAACGGDDGESTAPAQATATPAGTPSAGETQAPAATAQSAAGKLDPCALVTKSDAEAILHISVGEPERQTVGPFESCIYSDGTLSNYVQVQVGSDVYTQSTFDDAMEAAAEELGIEAEGVSGVGDNAYGLAGVLWVQKGDVTLNFVVHTPVITELEQHGYGEQRQLVLLALPLASKALEALP
jgi:hypothetical protein